MKYELKLKRGKEASILRRHPWIFSGALVLPKSKVDGPQDGDIVVCTDSDGTFLGVGHYSHGTSIAVRLLSLEDIPINDAFWFEKINRAKNSRKKMIDHSRTNGYRLIHGEGDGLPGLIIDIFDKSAVIQCHSTGMFLAIDAIGKSLDRVFDNQLNTIYCKSKETLAELGRDFWIKGDAGEGAFLENGIQYFADWQYGQKTGFFLDQRENRFLLGRYASGQSVLDLFCNLGGFGLNALQAGASSLTAVDSSSRAMDKVAMHLSLNGFSEKKIHLEKMDCLPFLKSSSAKFDIVICDPPAFAKSVAKRHNAVQGYKRLNAMAMQAVGTGGLLFTFSCSQVVDESLFYNTIVAAGIESGKSIKVLHKLNQGPDHPVNLFHKEGSYLKGLVVEIA
jgi:23S rRNA (cytosine1962-C5)-methyltransferase